ncbi:unnamed protein product [Moneuplotes crassus]|uniref:Uncharacterized protein n=1 Tax=Euplotes crassus TaxID=5936 RepID=A0AAD2DA28_EUPCR|nr:unnamed protein product [Moneuplotes crassus]
MPITRLRLKVCLCLYTLDGALFNKNKRFLDKKMKKEFTKTCDPSPHRSTLEITPTTGLEHPSPSNEGYVNFMGRVQGGKIRSQSAADYHKNKIRNSGKNHKKLNTIKIPTVNPFMKNATPNSLNNGVKKLENHVLRCKTPSQSYTIKYVGLTFGQIGVLSQKVPLEPVQKEVKTKYEAPKPLCKKTAEDQNCHLQLNDPKSVKRNKIVAKLNTCQIKQEKTPNKSETLSENSLKTPPRDLEIIETANTQLQRKATSPQEDDIGSPKMINFDFDTLHQNDNFSSKKNSGCSPPTNLTPKLSKPSQFHNIPYILTQKKPYKKPFTSKSQKLSKSTKKYPNPNPHKPILPQKFLVQPNNTQMKPKKTLKQACTNLSTKSIKTQKKNVGNKTSYLLKRQNKSGSGSYVKSAERSGVAGEEGKEIKKVKITKHEFLSQSRSSSGALLRGDKSLSCFKKKKEEYLVNNYALPRGLSSCQRVPVLSESEKFFDNKYSKQAIGELKIKNCFTILERIGDNVGFRGCDPYLTSQGRRRNPILQVKNFTQIESSGQKQCRLRNTNDLNIKTATEEFDKNGRVLNPNFSVTPSKSLASMANLGVSSIITSPICYTDSENKDIQKVKNLVNKYKSNQLATHKYVEDTELHENLISGGSSPTKMMKDESIDIQCQIVKKNSDLEIPKQENLFKNEDIHKSINNSSKKQEGKCMGLMCYREHICSAISTNQKGSEPVSKYSLPLPFILATSWSTLQPL